MQLHCWIQDSLRRVFPTGNAGSQAGRLRLDAAAGDRLSFQVAIESLQAGDPIRVSVAADAPPWLRLRLRRVGYVPVPHHNTETPPAELDCVGHVPGYVPDPLFDEQEALLPAGQVAAFWISVTVDPDAKPGLSTITLAVSCQGERAAELAADLTVHAVRIEARRGFPVTQWFYADALLDWYGLDGFEERFWSICREYLADVADHGQDTIYVPALTPSLDGVKRPTQLLAVQADGDRYSFDWSLVVRYVRLARECGIRYFEWPHHFTQWGVKNAIRVYRGRGEDERLLWPPEASALSPQYKGFLSQYLPALHGLLVDEGILQESMFHVSDEPHGEEARGNYTAARKLLRDLAPWMQTMDALSDISYGRERLTDMPIASISTACDFAREGLPSWAYYCCGPRGEFLNRLLDTPLAKIRMSGWLFHRFGMRGFLHWGLNYWYRHKTRTLIDPFTELAAGMWPGLPHGDPFVLYPGERGPLDSIRWEIFSESLTDYALLQTLRIDPRGEELSALAGFDHFPKSVDWLRDTRRRLLARGR